MTLTKNNSRAGIMRLNQDNPTRIVNKMCKHFSHRVPIKDVDGVKEIIFFEGSCHIATETNSIRFTLHAKNENDLFLIRETIDRHISQFTQEKQNKILWPLS